MPVNMPHMGNIGVMGSQFKSDVFAKVGRKATSNARNMARKAAASPASNVRMPQQPERTSSPAGPNDAPLSDNAVAEGRARRQAKAGYAPSAPKHAAPDFSAANVAKGHALERGATSTHAAPTFVSRKDASAGTPSFSSAPTAGTPRPANVFRDSATHSTPTFSDVNKMSTPPAPRTAPTTTPFQAPTMQPQQFREPRAATPKTVPKLSSQPVDTSTKANDPYPTHVHPENSSNMSLPNASAAHSTPLAPQQFTIGSRNIKGGGIASMGSKLEEGLATRPLTLPPKRKRI